MSATLPKKIPIPNNLPNNLKPNLFYKALLNGFVYHLINKTINPNDKIALMGTASVIASSLAFHC